MSCLNCEECNKDTQFVCRLDGDFYTTGEYARILNQFQIHGVTFNQKVDSVKDTLDIDTIKILKALICESNRWPYSTDMEIVFLLDEILSRLSNDNKIDNSFHSRGDDE